MPRKVSKIAYIKAHLASGKSLTQLEAIGLYGAYRLSARVHELKSRGWIITNTLKRDAHGDIYSEYKLDLAAMRKASKALPGVEKIAANATA